jgi:hypothetical protein
VLEGILPEQNGLSRPPRTHDPGEMFAFLALQLSEEEALLGVGPALLLRKVVQL